jgi:hypothetical protein
MGILLSSDKTTPILMKYQPPAQQAADHTPK